MAMIDDNLMKAYVAVRNVRSAIGSDDVRQLVERVVTSVNASSESTTIVDEENCETACLHGSQYAVFLFAVGVVYWSAGAKSD